MKKIVTLLILSIPYLSLTSSASNRLAAALNDDEFTDLYCASRKEWFKELPMKELIESSSSSDSPAYAGGTAVHFTACKEDGMAIIQADISIQGESYPYAARLLQSTRHLKPDHAYTVSASTTLFVPKDARYYGLVITHYRPFIQVLARYNKIQRSKKEVVQPSGLKKMMRQGD